MRSKLLLIHPISRLLLLLAGSIFAVWLMWTPPAITSAEVECGLLSGVSGSASTNSGVVDFEYADYSSSETRTVDGTTIAEASRVCVTDTGDADGYAWNTNAGWFDFGWCLSSVCEGIGQPEMDPDTGYWSGYIWSENIGWTMLDWDCTSCDTSLRMKTDVETGELSGYGWNDTVGWLKFSGGDVAQEILVPDLTAYPVVTISPDPLTATKYGTSSTPAAPLADGDEEYKVVVQFYVPDLSYPSGGYYLDDSEYEVTIEVNSASHLYTNQVAQAGDNAVVFPYSEAVYSSSDEGWVYTIRSFAPTSNVNGYDEDGDGSMDFYFDIDPADPDGLERSDSVNEYAIDALGFTV
ncbi:MAG: hypothetical protein Q8P27_02860, partial [Candidatus Peregrinibacteria bacterium]|nr:hypothetical protein [Candidatus Peregrinibacteria bacterium]